MDQRKDFTSCCAVWISIPYKGPTINDVTHILRYGFLTHILLNMLMEYCHLLADPSPTKCMTSVMTSFMDGP